jgi:penicillin-binding protein 1B
MNDLQTELTIEPQTEPPLEPAPDPEPRKRRFSILQSKAFRMALVGAIAVLSAGVVVTRHYYLKFARLTDVRLAAGPFSDTIDIFAAPRTVLVGDPATTAEIVARLRRNGYNTSHSNPLGWYDVRPQSVAIFPGRGSQPGSEPAVIEIAKQKISRIVSLDDNTERQEYPLAPQLIANLSRNHERRRLVTFRDIPPDLVHAVISAEDKHFFHHTGIDLFRIVKAAYVDMKDGRKEQGASTLTMQLARGFWLDSEKSWSRKAAELLITLHLEHKLTKQQIFEDYANQVYLGRRGPFSINGFGEASRAFLGKDISQLTNAEAALLAGLVQRPSYYNPYRYPDRARDRRNIVLGMMHENGYLSDAQYRDAVATPVELAPERSEGIEAPYFIDYMNDELQNRMSDNEKHARFVYTTIDPDLQRAAEEAVHLGMAEVDREIRRQHRKSVPAGQPQVALVALDPRTGEIKALVGGRNYNGSQLNHALAMRQPGSVFKPFVYSAALETAVRNASQIFTPATMLDDTPTTFTFGDQTYMPGNFDNEFMGNVTLRTALAHSLNVATVSLAQQVGYGNVVAVARRLGLNEDIKPTPSVALGAYETTPVEIAGAYTAFANQGLRVSPDAISVVRGADGGILYRHQPDPVQALDPRVAYLVNNMMQDVLRYGTGAGVRARGFTLPAAGKTGTAHDGWFAGFTSQLVCVVWVGFDDNRDLNLEGAHSALPVWTDFMKLAAKLRPYRDAKAFQAPQGVVTAEICPDSGQLATPNCPKPYEEVFIDGTEPVVPCQVHSPGIAQQNGQANPNEISLPDTAK